MAFPDAVTNGRRDASIGLVLHEREERQATGKTAVPVIPSARRLVRSLRDLGYDFVHAVADLVDNSIAAAASRVALDIRFDGRESWVRIADDGRGMIAEALTEAMRYGSERDYEPGELGKFGLGLKTASTSQCRRLTVVSRSDPTKRRVEARVLDLDHIEKTNRWEVHRIDASDLADNLTDPLREGTGTVVLWESLDRILSYKVPWGERAKAGLLTLAERLDQHLGMVFHRFLDGSANRRKRLAITINGTTVEPWNPFAIDEKYTEKLTEQEFEITSPSGKGVVRFRPYVLPPRERFSDEAAFNRAGGPERWNKQQGFYVYRADRLIQSGGWSWMRTADEHTKLARAALEFFPDLDSAFEINVAKMRVSLPADLRELLKEPVERLAKRAREIYDRKTAGAKSGGHTSPSGFAGSGDGRVAGGSHSSARLVPSSKQRNARNALERAARKTGEEKALASIVSELVKDDPEVARELGW